VARIIGALCENLRRLIASLSYSYNEKYFRTKVVEKIKTLISFSIFFPLTNRAVYEIMKKKQYKAGQTTYDNITSNMRFA
jgi:hypothetical protein